MSKHLSILVFLSFLLPFGQFASVWHNLKHIAPIGGNAADHSHLDAAAHHSHVDHHAATGHGKVPQSHEHVFVTSQLPTIDAHQTAEVEGELCLIFHLHGCHYANLPIVSEIKHAVFLEEAPPKLLVTQNTPAQVSAVSIRGPPTKS